MSETQGPTQPEVENQAAHHEQLSQQQITSEAQQKFYQGIIDQLQELKRSAELPGAEQKTQEQLAAELAQLFSQLAKTSLRRDSHGTSTGPTNPAEISIPQKPDVQAGLPPRILATAISENRGNR